jgi:hypothetical protein
MSIGEDSPWTSFYHELHRLEDRNTQRRHMVRLTEFTKFSLQIVAFWSLVTLRYLPQFDRFI